MLFGCANFLVFFTVNALLSVAIFPRFSTCQGQPEENSYRVGVGLSDVTGPSAEVELWGYATFHQGGRGIHFRVYSRAVVIVQNQSRVVLVTVDLGSVSEILKIKVVERLAESYGNLYRIDNVVITATHTHSAPGGLHQYVLYTLPSEGFIKQTFEAAVRGIVRSIVVAHENLRPGRLFVNSGILLDSNYNRSPSAYANNPIEERNQYKYNVDKTMTVLKITDEQLNPLGAISWFPVHPTSMNNTNKLVSGDNKGYASLRMEKFFNGKGSLPGMGPFVGAFPQSAHGDTSPNMLGATCIDTGLPCDYTTSSCDGMSDKCIAFGPGKDMFESTKMIGESQFQKAKELFLSATEELKGPLIAVHQHIDISNFVVNDKPSSKTNAPARTCPSALGYSFAAGTTDGPGARDFVQGTTRDASFWNFIRGFIRTPSEQLKMCQAPKPILLATGEINFPYAWQPKILPTQVIKIGQLIIAPVPGEFTTMSGRRVAKAIEKVHNQLNPDEKVRVVVQSLSNTYSSYVTTFEEYQIQRYEGASTVYGPHTLEAYLQQYQYLTEMMLKDKPVSPGPKPPNMLANQIIVKPGVLYDTAGMGATFGQVTKDVESKYKTGEKVEVTFISGHPRNDLKLGSTYLTVERFNETQNSWNVIATDANWETKFHWKRLNLIMGTSRVTIEWIIPEDADPGIYRMRHFGAKKNVFQQISPYSGTSSSFRVFTKIT